MIDRYGDPPAWGDCLETTPPEGMLLKFTPVNLPLGADGMLPIAGRTVSVIAVARQLNLHFDFGSKTPIKVFVQSHGYFRIGPGGWAYSKTKPTDW